MKTRKQRYNEIISADKKELNACVIELAESYLRYFPESQGGWDMYSLALYRVARLKDAETALKKSIRLLNETNKAERSSWLFCRMGHIYKSKGNFRKAIDWYDKASAANPQEATFLIFSGILLSRLKKHSEASEILNKATQCAEGCIDEAFYNLGVVRITQRRYEDALTCFEKALEIDPKYKEAKQQFKDITQVLAILKNEGFRKSV